MDFASGLMSFTTGAVKGGIKLQKQSYTICYNLEISTTT